MSHPHFLCHIFSYPITSSHIKIYRILFSSAIPPLLSHHTISSPVLSHPMFYCLLFIPNYLSSSSFGQISVHPPCEPFLFVPLTLTCMCYSQYEWSHLKTSTKLLRHIMLYYAVLQRVVMYIIALHDIVVYWIVQCVSLHCIALHCIALHCIAV